MLYMVADSKQSFSIAQSSRRLILAGRLSPRSTHELRQVVRQVIAAAAYPQSELQDLSLWRVPKSFSAVFTDVAQTTFRLDGAGVVAVFAVPPAGPGRPRICGVS